MTIPKRGFLVWELLTVSVMLYFFVVALSYIVVGGLQVEGTLGFLGWNTTMWPVVLWVIIFFVFYPRFGARTFFVFLIANGSNENFFSVETLLPVVFGVPISSYEVSFWWWEVVLVNLLMWVIPLLLIRPSLDLSIMGTMVPIALLLLSFTSIPASVNIFSYIPFLRGLSLQNFLYLLGYPWLLYGTFQTTSYSVFTDGALHLSKIWYSVPLIAAVLLLLFMLAL